MTFNCSCLNFLKYEENFIFFFISAQQLLVNLQKTRSHFKKGYVHRRLVLYPYAIYTLWFPSLSSSIILKHRWSGGGNFAVGFSSSWPFVHPVGVQIESIVLLPWMVPYTVHARTTSRGFLPSRDATYASFLVETIGRWYSSARQRKTKKRNKKRSSLHFPF